MNSHNLDQSRAVSTRLLGLHAGQIVLDGAPAAVTDADLTRIYGDAGKRGCAMTRSRGRRWARALGVLALFVLAFWLTGCDPAKFGRGGRTCATLPRSSSRRTGAICPRSSRRCWPRCACPSPARRWACCWRSSSRRCARRICRARHRCAGFCGFLVQVLRPFPALILALLATFLFGLGTFSGTVAITLFTLAVMTRLTYEDIETLTLAPYRALCAMGASPARAYARAVVPEIASGYLTNALYLLETNVRHSAILGYVGAGGIGLLLNEKISWREYGRVGAILVCLFVTVCCIEWLSHVLGRMIRGERNVPRRAKRVLWAAVLVCVVVCTAGIEAPDLAHTSKSVLAAMGDGLLHPDWAFSSAPASDGSAGCCSRRSASRWPAPARRTACGNCWRFGDAEAAAAPSCAAVPVRSWRSAPCRFCLRVHLHPRLHPVRSPVC